MPHFPQGQGFGHLPQGGCDEEVDNGAGGVLIIVDADENATIELTGFDDFDAYEISITCLTASANNSFLIIDMSTDGGSTWEAGASDYIRHPTRYMDTNDSVSTDPSSSSAANIILTHTTTGEKLGNASGESLSAVLSFGALLSSGTYKRFTFKCQYVDADGHGMTVYGAGGYVGSTDPVNGIRFRLDTGNVNKGKIKLKGKGAKNP